MRRFGLFLLALALFLGAALWGYDPARGMIRKDGA